MENITTKKETKGFNIPIASDLHQKVADYVYFKKTSQKIIGTALLSWFFSDELTDEERAKFLSKWAQ